MTKRIKLLRSDNCIVVSPTTPLVKDIIVPHLEYTEKVTYRGRDLAIRRHQGLSEYEYVEWACYTLDHKNRLTTSYGFSGLIKKLLRAQGYTVKTEWATEADRKKAELRNATVYKPRWDRIDDLVKNGFKFRPKQRKALEIIASKQNGRIDCHTGWGKGTLIMLACILFPKAKIDVITRRIAVLHQRLYPELTMSLPSVGLVGGGKRIKSRRVMCLSAGSTHHGRPDADFVFVDEGHEACADDFATALGMYRCARMFSFSASWDMRLDNKNIRGLSMFGPIRLRVPYQEGVENGIVVPMEVHWSNVISDTDPCAGISNTVEKKRAALWTNTFRNKIIAKDARLYGPNLQTMISVETLEHALNLKRLLPEYTIVYSGQGLKEQDVRKWKSEFPDEFRVMDKERLAKLTRRFQEGKLKKVIATTVWNVGVDFRHLEVLIRADGGGSPINDTQLPGRNSRKKRQSDIDSGASEKFVGIIRDYLDQFNVGFSRRAQGRRASYVKNGWKQIDPDKLSRVRSRFAMSENIDD